MCISQLGSNSTTCEYPCPGLEPIPACPTYLAGQGTYPNQSAFVGWVVIAFAATIAGNLTLVGSAANLIVDSRARAAGGPELKFMRYLPYGFPTTMLFAFIGLLLILVVVGGL